MIVPNELRIGNLVMLNNRRVKINGYHFWHYMFPDDAKHSIEIDFTPIPLTPEILEQCEFEIKDDNPKQKFQYKGDILFSILDFEFSNSDKGQDGGFYSYQINEGKTIVKYLHQLQNLFFALTGEELPVNL